MPDRRYVYSVDIDIADARQAARQIRTIFQNELQTIQAGGVATAGRQAAARAAPAVMPQRAVGGLASGLAGSLGGALAGGLAGYATVAGAQQIVRTTVALAELGTEARRAESAFIALSGSQEEADAKLRAIQDASGGAIDRLQAMQVANKAAALGLANTSEELERVVRFATISGRVLGMDTAGALDNLSAAAANLSFVRLDQMGISATRVRARIKELQEEFTGMSREAAFLEATLDIGEQTFSSLTDAALTQASGIERLRAAWADLNTTVAEQGSALDRLAGRLADEIQYTETQIRLYNELDGLLSDTDSGVRSYAESIAQLQREQALGFLTAEEYNLRLEMLLGGLDAYREGQIDAAIATDGTTAAMTRGISALIAYRQAAAGVEITDPTMAQRGGAPDPYFVGDPNTPRIGDIMVQRRAEEAELVDWRFENERALAAIMFDNQMDLQRIQEDNARKAARDFESAANEAERAWIDSARKLEGQLSNVPGLLGTSAVTAEQMRQAELGVSQSFADDYLRRLTDEVLNKVDWAGVDIGDAAARAGIDPNLPAEAILSQFTERWRDQSLFADPRNLELINRGAVEASLAQQRAGEEGRANILAMFGLSSTDDPILSETGAAIAKPIASGFNQGLMQTESGVSYATDFAATMQTQFQADDVTTQFGNVGALVARQIHSGFMAELSNLDFAGGVASVAAQQAAEMALTELDNTLGGP